MKRIETKVFDEVDAVKLDHFHLISQFFRSQDDPTERLILDTPVEMFIKPSIRHSSVGFQEHQRQLALRTELRRSTFTILS